MPASWSCQTFGNQISSNFFWSLFCLHVANRPIAYFVVQVLYLIIFVEVIYSFDFSVYKLPLPP